MDIIPRFVVAVPIPGKSVKIVAAAIYTLWIAIFGTPGTIPCDSCNEFNNSLIATIKKIEYKA